MGKKLEENFKKRFGERIEVVYADKPLSPTEKRLQNEKITQALSDVLSGILKRPITPEELLGIKDVSIKKKKRRGPFLRTETLP